jgi:hypothetical protein
MGYTVVYDAAMEQFQWWPRAGIPMLVLLFSLILILVDRDQGRKGGTSRFHPRQRLGFYAMRARSTAVSISPHDRLSQ